MLKKKKEARDHSALPSLSLLITRKPPKSRSREPSAFLPSFLPTPTNTNTRTNKAITLGSHPCFLPHCEILVLLSGPGLLPHTTDRGIFTLTSTSSQIIRCTHHPLVASCFPCSAVTPVRIHCGINQLRRLLSAPLSSRGLTTLDDVCFSSLPLDSSLAHPGFIVIGPRRLFLCPVFVSFESSGPSNEILAPPRHSSLSGPVLDTSSRQKTHLQDLVDDVGIYSSTAEHPPDGCPGRLLSSHCNSTSLTGYSASLLAPISSPVGPSDGQPATARHLTASLLQEPITPLYQPFRPEIEASPRRVTAFLILASSGSFAFELLALYDRLSLLLYGILSLSLLPLLPSTA
ncbi:hypothetical protein BDP67DRAFT_88741 [Colletotrichum lupini]|nr:hypothetical protein BDP67DRAFT_88741 [Colletotrichum lupini]